MELKILDGCGIPANLCLNRHTYLGVHFTPVETPCIFAPNSNVTHLAADGCDVPEAPLPGGLEVLDNPVGVILAYDDARPGQN